MLQSKTQTNRFKSRLLNNSNCEKGNKYNGDIFQKSNCDKTQIGRKINK